MERELIYANANGHFRWHRIANPFVHSDVLALRSTRPYRQSIVAFSNKRHIP